MQNKDGKREKEQHKTTEQITTMKKEELKEIIKQELNEVTRDKSEHKELYTMFTIIFQMEYMDCLI